MTSAHVSNTENVRLLHKAELCEYSLLKQWPKINICMALHMTHA
jgi:hypothetical protein